VGKSIQTGPEQQQHAQNETGLASSSEMVKLPQDMCEDSEEAGTLLGPIITNLHIGKGTDEDT
jgi:hypothetical protein